MPELIEVELYRRALDTSIGAQLRSVIVHDPDYIRPRPNSPAVFRQIEGLLLHRTRRKGKLLLLDFAPSSGDPNQLAGPITVGLRFGMTGMLLVDGTGPIEQLEYASPRKEPAWDRVTMILDDSRVSIRDQRRLGSIELDPDEDRLGPDAQTVSNKTLAKALVNRRRALKTVLLDQAVLAGMGNLLADEVLWRSGFAPDRLACQLDSDETARLADAVRDTIDLLMKRGGSHTGDTFAHRVEGASCPDCRGAMRRSIVGGRTSWWCSEHQR